MVPRMEEGIRIKPFDKTERFNFFEHNGEIVCTGRVYWTELSLNHFRGNNKLQQVIHEGGIAYKYAGEIYR